MTQFFLRYQADLQTHLVLTAIPISLVDTCLLEMVRDIAGKYAIVHRHLRRTRDCGRKTTLKRLFYVVS